LRFIALLTLSACSFCLQGAEQNPARWEKEIAAFEAVDRTNPPPRNAVLFVGSSSVRYWTNLASDFPELKVINRGFGGSHVADSTYFADRIIFPYQPSKIVLYAGDNDIGRGRSPEQVFEDFGTLVEKVHAKLPETKIYYLAIKPSPLRWYLSPQSKDANQRIRRYARFHSNVEFIDVWSPLIKDGSPNPDLYESDRLHINRKGYELWIPIVRKALEN
jgi:lysophospholipase L1-like esterase